MSQLALISDVHGNGVALDAVLAELARRDIEDIVCLGDVAAGGPQPRQVVGRLRDLRCQLVRGNADTWLIDGLPAGRSDETRRLDEVVAWTHTQLAPDDVEYLAALPLRLRVTTRGLRLFCFHGSPRADIDALLATTPECELDELFADAQEADVLAGGHTHLQLLRSYGQRVLVNPGSVGLPLGSLRSSASGPPLPAWADYALLEVRAGGVEIAFRRVPVDLAALAAQTEAMPHATWAVDLERRIKRWNRRAGA